MFNLIRPLLLSLVYWLLLTGVGHAQHTDIYPRPVPMGVSVSTTPSDPFLFAGTAGLRVESWFNPQFKMILSNNHVLGTVGPDLCPNTADQSTFVLQPGTLDLGFDPGSPQPFGVGRFVASIPIDFGLGSRNLVDAAVALTSDSLSRSEQLGIGEPNPQVGIALPGMALVKSGRTTGVTTGRVQSIGATVIVDYGADCGVATFVNQVITTGGLGESGDSGSVVLEQETLTPVGLYFAGSLTTGVMNQIAYVYASLGVVVEGFFGDAVSTVANVKSELAANQRFATARAAMTAHEARLFANSEVVGVGIGLDDRGLTPVINVYCRSVSAAVRRAIPSALDGVPVRLIESGEIVAH